MTGTQSLHRMETPKAEVTRLNAPQALSRADDVKIAAQPSQATKATSQYRFKSSSLVGRDRSRYRSEMTSVNCFDLPLKTNNKELHQQSQLRQLQLVKLSKEYLRRKALHSRKTVALASNDGIEMARVDNTFSEPMVRQTH